MDLLLKRDYPNIAAFDGSKNGMVGTIFIPESYLPKKPKVVNPEISDEIKSQFPDDKKLLGEIKQTKGDLLERKVYEALKEYFNNKPNENVLVIQGIEMVKLGGIRGRDKQEVDFLVINFSHQYIRG